MAGGFVTTSATWEAPWTVQPRLIQLLGVCRIHTCHQRAGVPVTHRPGRCSLRGLVPTLRGIILYPRAGLRQPASFPTTCRCRKHLAEVRVGQPHCPSQPQEEYPNLSGPVTGLLLSLLLFISISPPSYGHANGNFCFLRICEATTNFCADQNMKSPFWADTSWQA